MQKDLVFVSVYPNFNRIFEEICWEIDHSYTIIDAKLEDAVVALKRTFPNDFPDVIISRGATAGLISQAFQSTIVVWADPDDTDLISSLIKAKKLGSRVGFLSHPEKHIEHTLEIMKEIFDFQELKLFTYTNVTDIERSVIEAKNDGIEVMVGGGQYASTMGIKHHLPYVFVESGKRSVWKAVTRALDILEYLEKEKEQDLRFRTLVGTIKDGVIAIRNNKIAIFNPAAEKILNVYAEKMIGKTADKIHPDITRFLNNKDNKDEVISIGKYDLLLDKIIKEDNKGIETILLLYDITQLQEMEQKTRTTLYAKGLVARYDLNDVVGETPIIKNLIAEARLYASTDANILITGDSGTGKELFAQGIHNASKRKDNPFVAVNCAEIPEQLLESELFGYVEGSFTGAKKGGKMGLLELAHRGTIFLDEINSTSIALQGKLLRVVQEKELRKIGSDNIIPVDIRILAAVNKDMPKLMEEQAFRKDLFYRLSTLTLHLPSLNERKSDIPILADYFRRIYCKKYRKKIPPFSLDIQRKIMNLKWLGNVRELENVVHRYSILFDEKRAKDNLILHCIENNMKYPDDISAEDNETKTESNEMLMLKRASLHEMETEIIITYLKESEWNKNEAARRLGISRTTLWRRLNESVQTN
jgi:transcriptional regulator with PAS, ATPase and Fis domain